MRSDLQNVLLRLMTLFIKFCFDLVRTSRDRGKLCHRHSLTSCDAVSYIVPVHFLFNREIASS
jgi:hypothetical protein